MNDELKKNLSSTQQWSRLLYMLFFAVCMYLAITVISIIVVIQFLFTIISGDVNTKLRDFSSSLVTYIANVWLFLSYNREVKPFPFEDWPASPDEQESAPAVKPKAAAKSRATKKPAAKKPAAKKSTTAASSRKTSAPKSTTDNKDSGESKSTIDNQDNIDNKTAIDSKTAANSNSTSGKANGADEVKDEVKKEQRPDESSTDDTPSPAV